MSSFKRGEVTPGATMLGLQEGTNPLGHGDTPRTQESVVPKSIRTEVAQQKPEIKNAPAEVKAVANYVTDTNNRDGVSKAIKKFMDL